MTNGRWGRQTAHLVYYYTHVQYHCQGEFLCQRGKKRERRRGLFRKGEDSRKDAKHAKRLFSAEL
jgi:hypothetical protein